jgi:hypothetical protein
MNTTKHTKHQGWIGVDLDGTLAHYTGWVDENHVGEPIPPMLARVKQWVADGREVRIFTARVGPHDPAKVRPDYRHRVVRVIHEWLAKHGLPRLEVTATKDYGMVELWDDRCVQVIPNAGTPLDSYIHIPDMRMCHTCGFTKQENVMVLVDGVEVPDNGLCPHDGDALQPIMWRQHAAQNQNFAGKMLEREQAVCQILVDGEIDAHEKLVKIKKVLFEPPLIPLET